MVTWPQVSRLLAAVTAAGGTIPAGLNEISATLDAVNAWTPKASDALESIIERGELTASNAKATLDAALIQPNRHPGDLTLTAETALTRRAAALIRADAGDQMIASLQPAHTAAVAAMADAAAIIGPSTTAEDALDIDGGVDAWQTLAQTRAILDRIDVIVQTLLEDFTVLGPQAPQLDMPRLRYITMYAENVDTRLDALATVLNSSHTRARGGRWHHAPGLIHLNTPSQARTIVDAYRERAQELADADYARTHG